MNAPAAPFDLVYHNEKRLAVLAVIVSLLTWAALIVGTLGGAIFYVGLFFIFYLFAHSAFISYLRGSGVQITAEQFPDLHKMLVESCTRVGLSKVPEAYVLHMGGLFNALATRFLGRNFVVLYSDVVDALDKNPDAVRFYVGHELGHIQRGHVQWGPWLLPAQLMPLLGKAYHRAREYTCDRFGLFCCLKPEDALEGMAALAAGGKRWQTLNVNKYVKQTDMSGGFWMSYHELSAGYPWLTKRMAWLQALPQSKAPSFPRRSFWGGLFAFFGSAKPLFFLLIIGAYIWFAVVTLKSAIPSLSGLFGSQTTTGLGTGAGPDFDLNTPTAEPSPIALRITAAMAAAEPAKAAIEKYVVENNKWPAANADVGIEQKSTTYGADIDSIVVADGIIFVAFGGDMAGKSLRLQSDVVEGKIQWSCLSGTIMQSDLPADCVFVSDTEEEDGAAPTEAPADAPAP